MATAFTMVVTMSPMVQTILTTGATSLAALALTTGVIAANMTAISIVRVGKSLFSKPKPLNPERVTLIVPENASKEEILKLIKLHHLDPAKVTVVCVHKKLEQMEDFTVVGTEGQEMVTIRTDESVNPYPNTFLRQSAAAQE